VVPITVLFMGWYFRYVLVAVFAPGFIRTSVVGHDPATGASLSLIADTHINFAFFPLDNPGIVSIPLAFFLGWLGSVTDRQPSDPARFARIQVRALTGVGAERGSHS
jgi:cation/acetate symporter